MLAVIKMRRSKSKFEYERVDSAESATEINYYSSVRLAVSSSSIGLDGSAVGPSIASVGLKDRRHT